MKHPTIPDSIRFEHPDPTPVEVPVASGRFPNTLKELEAQARLRQFLAVQLMDETFEESDDFDVEDDHPDPKTPWEIAADATTLTPDQLFMSVYGISREEANARLAALSTPKSPPADSGDNSPNSGAGVPQK